MQLNAIVSASRTAFCALLSDGRRIEADHLYALARDLFYLGVQPHAVRFEWRAGQRMMTAGQQVAFAADMHFMARESAEAAVTA